MNRRTYLQALGAAVGTATVASAGVTAAEGDDLPEVVRQAPVGASNAKVPEVPNDVIDVRDHGAQLDGSTDDRDALQSALDAAASSEGTVYIPEGEVLVDGRVFFKERHNGVTLRGAGSGTHVRLAGGQGGTHSVFHVKGRNEPIQGLTIASLRIDGQKEKQSDTNGWGIVTYNGGYLNQDILIQNVWVHDCAGTNLVLGAAGTRVENASVWNAGRWHGVLTNPKKGEPLVLDGIHAYNNGIHGLDCSRGHTVVRNTLTEENGWGAKNTDNTDSCTWKNVVFRNNDNHGYMIPVATQGPITFDNVLAEGNGRSGFRFNEKGEVQIKTLVARANDSTGNGDGNIYIGGSMEVDADTVYSFDSYTDGLVLDDYNGGPNGHIDTYVHGGNDRDVIRGDRGNLSLGTIKRGEYPDIDPLGGESVDSLDSESMTSAGLPVTDGLVLSLNASTGVSTSDGRVTGWADQSGRGNDLTANGNPTLTTAPSGAKAINFDGSGDELVRTGDLSGFPTGSEPRTVMTVSKYESTGFGGVTYGSPSWNDAFGPVVNDEGELTVQGWGHSNDYPSGVAGTGAGWLTQSVTYDGSQFVHYENGEQIDSGTHSFATKDGKFTVGAELDTSPYLNMQVGAVAVYDRSLSDDERQQVQQHLQSQYLSNS